MPSGSHFSDRIVSCACLLIQECVIVFLFFGYPLNLFFTSCGWHNAPATGLNRPTRGGTDKPPNVHFLKMYNGEAATPNRDCGNVRNSVMWLYKKDR